MLKSAGSGYADIKRQLVREIRGGRWGVDDVIPSENVLRERFNCSRATVVRSLNELVLAGYLYRKRGKGTYVADFKATEYAATLPLFVEAATYRLSGNARQTLMRIMYGIESALGPTHPGFTVRQVPAQLDDVTLRSIDELKCEVALVVEPSSIPGLVERLTKNGCSVWAINEPRKECNCVFVDQEESGYVATRHLIKKGRRRIALLNGPVDVYWGFAAKLAGYRRALAEAGLPQDARLVREGARPIDSEAGREMMRALIAEGVEFDGVVAASDSKGIGAMAQASEMGRRVPEDVAFISIDNTIADQADPPLSAVELPFADMGRQAVTRALESVNARDKSVSIVQQIRLQPFVVERG
jgi:DNA-binding LacI/PurR family transcriptional regulator/DNA-binding transcriptional regulator YhcF (GntR family)